MIKKTYDFAQPSQSNLKLFPNSQFLSITHRLYGFRMFGTYGTYMDVSWNRPTPLIQLGIPPLMEKKHISFVYPSDIPLNHYEIPLDHEINPIESMAISGT